MLPLVPDEQARAPLFEALLAYADRAITPIHTPGHKSTSAAGGERGLLQLITTRGLSCDLPSLDATDNIRHPTGVIAEAQRLAAALYGAHETLFLTGGATQGVHTMLLAALAPGDEVIVARNVHLSAFAGLVLSGAVPRYLPATSHSAAGLLPPTIDEVQQTFDAHPDARALLLTQPTYYGLGRDLREIALRCRARGVALLVDEAHGAHLRFLPAGHARSALDDGADLVVQSAHKTLDSLVGTAWIHRANASLVSAQRLRAAHNLLCSTSPSYLSLASLDLTRRDLARDGAERFERATQRALCLRAQLATLHGVRPLEAGSFAALSGLTRDPLRMVVDVSRLGVDGFACERRLRDEFQLYGEWADRRNVGYVLGPPDSQSAYDRLLAAFARIAADAPALDVARDEDTVTRVALAPMVLTPREAATREAHAAPLDQSLGKIAGEIVTVYPPGIPLICPGERFTSDVIDELRRLRALDAPLLARDATMDTVLVLE